MWEYELTNVVSLLYLFFIVTIGTFFGIQSYMDIQYKHFPRFFLNNFSSFAGILLLYLLYYSLSLTDGISVAAGIGRRWVRMATDTPAILILFAVFSVPPGKFRDNILIRPRQLPSKSSPINHSSTIVQFDVIYIRIYI